MNSAKLPLVIGSPFMTDLLRNRCTDRCLKLDGRVFRIHSKLLNSSPFLARQITGGTATMLHLDHLKSIHKDFTSCGLNIVIEWMYGKEVKFSSDKLTEALAAAFALELYGMVDAIEQAVWTYCKDLSALTVFLHHFESYTSEMKQKLLRKSTDALEEICEMTSFRNLSLPIFKKVVEKAINKMKDSECGPFGVIKAIALWESKNCSYNISTSLLRKLSFDSLSNAEMNRLVEMARKLGLKKLAEYILRQYRTLKTSHVIRGLLCEDDSIKICAADADQNVARRKVSAVKTFTETRLNEDESEYERKRVIASEPTPLDEGALENAVDSLKEPINFGVVPLDKSVNNLNIEVIYRKTENAVKDETVKLFFHIESDLIESDCHCAMK